MSAHPRIYETDGVEADLYLSMVIDRVHLLRTHARPLIHRFREASRFLVTSKELRGID